jgi:hypothetical protein
MTVPTTELATGAAEGDDDLLTRAEASAYLLRFAVHLKPATLARIWSTGGDGPPCEHIRGKPWYPRGALRDWAQAQRTGLRRNRREAKLDPRIGS